MARKIVTVDEQLKLPPAVETALKADLDNEFGSALTQALNAADAAAASETQAESYRDQVLIAQAEIENTIHDWNVDTNDEAVAALITEEDTQTSEAIVQRVDQAVEERGIPDMDVAALIEDEQSDTGKAVKVRGVMRFESEMQRDFYVDAPEEGMAAIVGSGPNQMEYRYRGGEWVPLIAWSVPASGVDGNLTNENMPDPVTIGDGADLNDYTSPGVYHQNLNVQAASGANYPIPIAGLLRVDRAAPNFLYQQYIPFTPGSVIFIRTKYADQPWRSWQPVGEARATVNGVNGLSGSATVVRNGSQIQMQGQFGGNPGTGAVADVAQIPVGFRPTNGIKSWCASSGTNEANRNVRFVAVESDGSMHILFSGAFDANGAFTAGSGGTTLTVDGLSWTTNDPWPTP